MYVELDQLNKRFGEQVAVQNVSLSIERREFVTLLGPSGSGKTTTLRLIAGFLVPTSGHIRIDGQPVESRPPHKRHLGMVFQDYSLFPHMDVYHNVAFGLRMRGQPRDVQRQRVAQALETVRLAGFESRHPEELSGGQRQRVALARAIVIEPLVLLLDEPLGALDRKLREEMQIELRRIHDELSVTTLFVTHDQDEALSLSDRVAILNEGRLVQIGTPYEVYEHPATPFVADFLGKANLLWLSVVASNDQGIEANLPGGSTLALAPDADVRAGDRVRILVRPERITLQRNADASEEGQIACTVERTVYLGTGAYLLLTGPGELELTAFLSAQELSAEGAPPTGQHVGISWSQGASTVVEHERA